MDPATLHPLLANAIEAVETAARVTRLVQRRIEVDTLTKGDKSPVTVADFASQALVGDVLGTEIPIVGEEDAAELRGDASGLLSKVCDAVQEVGRAATPDEICDWIDRGGHDGSGERYWTLDPIDGTKGFLRKEQYAISLALIENGTIVLGVLGCPNLALDAVTIDKSGSEQSGTLQYAVRGGGAYQRGFAADSPTVRLTAAATADPAAIRLCESVESGHSSHSHSARIRTRLGSTAESARLDSQAKYAVVARGDADAYLRLPTRPGYEEKIWDHAGGVIVVLEAGGRVSDVDGEPLDFSQGATLKRNRGVVATSPDVFDSVGSAVKAVLAEDAPPADRSSETTVETPA